jgi:hypothetical protein
MNQLPLNIALVGGAADVTVEFEPEVIPEQPVTLIVGDRQVPSRARGAQTATITFHVSDMEPGEYFLRLRVDGVDSPLIDFAQQPPVFRADQKVVFT